MRAERPKQLLALNGTPILIHTIAKFDAAPVDRLHHCYGAPRNPSMRVEVPRFAAQVLKSRFKVIEGGERRQDSVASWSATSAAGHHSGCCSRCGAAIRDVGRDRKRRPAGGAKRSSDSRLFRLSIPSSRQKRSLSSQTLDARTSGSGADARRFFAPRSSKKPSRARERMNTTAQTNRAWLKDLDLPVAIVHGSERNIKITRPTDLTLARAFLEEEKTTQ